MPEGPYGVIPRPFVSESTLKFMVTVPEPVGFSKVNFEQIMDNDSNLGSPVSSRLITGGGVTTIVVGSSRRTFSQEEIDEIRDQMETAIETADGGTVTDEPFVVTTVKDK